MSKDWGVPIHCHYSRVHSDQDFTWIVPVKVPYMSSTDLFENYHYSIGLCAKKKLLKNVCMNKR